MKIEKLQPPDWRIYNYIKLRSEAEIYTPQNEIVRFLSLDDVFIGKREVRKSIHRLKSSDRIQKVIISGKQGYKILSDKEEIAILDRRRIAILSSLNLYYKDIDRLHKNGQIRFTPINSRERAFFESVLKTGGEE